MKFITLILGLVIFIGGTAMAFDPTHVQRVKSKRDCQQCDLSNANLAGADLRGVNLANGWMRSANLKGANLAGAILSYANLTGANLEGANLRGADVYGAMLMGANLRNAVFDEADLSEADFGPGKSGGKQFGKADVAGATFDGASLRGVKGLEVKAAPKRFHVPDSAVVRGGPSKDFLGTEIYVISGGSPMAGAFSVHQIVDALGEAKKDWEALEPGQWLLTIQKDDRVSGKQMNLKMLFTRHRTEDESGVLLARAIINGQEMNQGQIFQLAQQLALKAEAKQ